MGGNNFKFLIVIILIYVTKSALSLSAQDTYRVLLSDKGPEKFQPGTEIYRRTSELISDRALERRKKVLPSDSLLMYDDAPLYQPYLDSITSAGANILLQLRWRNYAVIEADSADLQKISQFSFIETITTTRSKLTTHSININTEPDHSGSILNLPGNCGAFDYGDSFTQADFINVDEVHSLGITGRGVLLGFLDTGFNWKKHNSMDHADVIAEYDFIFHDSVTANQEADTSVQHSHGTNIFSIAAGFDQGNLIGTCPNASFILAKTENIRSETNMEEDNYAAAIEWMEARGVDITSSSLGYKSFDSLQYSYRFKELDGNTTITARALNDAARRGVICVTSAGNNGPKGHTIITPADAGSAIAAASIKIDSLGNVVTSEFSSRGPNAEGSIKPNISALGEKIVGADAYGKDNYRKVGGTSASAPQIAGSLALMLSRFPELPPWKLREHLYQSGDQSNNPDSIRGCGIPDIFEAIKSAGIVISPPIIYPVKDFQRTAFFIISENNLSRADLYARFTGSLNFEKYSMYPTGTDNLFAADIPLDRFSGDSAECYIIADEHLSQRRCPFDKDNYFTISPEQTTIPCGIDPSALDRLATEAPTAYVYPTVVTDKRDHITLNVTLEKQSDIKYDIFNSAGEKLFTNHVNMRSPGLFTSHIKINSLASGIYFIKIEISGRNEIISFSITR